jgi:beta-carotene ketolase (CrtW type)
LTPGQSSAGQASVARAARRSQLLATLLVLGWLASLGLGLAWVMHPLPQAGSGFVLIGLALVLLRSFLQTGLFIVGHDAMHRLLVPGAVGLNDRLGAMVLGLYAALPYGSCRRQHLLHHRHPGEVADPDFHRPGAGSALAWYGQFMGRYLTGRQMACLLTGWGLLAWCTSIPAVLLVCTLPLLLSSLQLFLVGTYLPHRRPAGQPCGEHQAPAVRSLDLPEWLSLLACFHFGYHREHHLAPQLAWHQLPACRRALPAVALATADFPK